MLDIITQMLIGVYKNEAQLGLSVITGQTMPAPPHVITRTTPRRPTVPDLETTSSSCMRDPRSSMVSHLAPRLSVNFEPC